MSSSEILEYVTELFPNKSLETIQRIINLVKDGAPTDNPEQQLENVVNLLMDHNYLSSVFGENDGTEEHLLDEAMGETSVNDTNLSGYYEQLINIFPDACPTYVRDLCHEKGKHYIDLDVLVSEMTLKEYPKKSIDVISVSEHLKDLLPNADPSYLEEQANALAYASEAELKKFVEDAIEKNNYPTMEDYKKNQKEINEVNRYTTHFNVKDFLKQFPNPDQYFSDPKRKCPLARSTSNDASKNDTLQDDELYALTFLYNYYKYSRKKDIERVFRMCNKSLSKTCSRLDKMRKAFTVARRYTDVEVVSKNIPLLQEIAYLENRKVIKGIIKECDENYRLAKADARKNGLLQTCNCCYDEELIPEECYFCNNGCIFCKDCVKDGTVVAIGDGKLDFPCLADCGSEFNIATLQMVLDSVVFSKMAQRKQMEEVKKANIDGLETCPFCDFATIPPPDTKIFKCLNEDCLKESCRECRHVAHIPLRCNEIEYDEDVKMRTYIENKMTEALLRTCWKCNKVFIKSSGCNKMTCSCGALMCYVCKKRVYDYNHFGQEGGSRCPLFTNDLNKFHNDAVLKGAVKAKVKLGLDKNPTKLKIDPTKMFKK